MQKLIDYYKLSIREILVMTSAYVRTIRTFRLVESSPHGLLGYGKVEIFWREIAWRKVAQLYRTTGFEKRNFKAT